MTATPLFGACVAAAGELRPLLLELCLTVPLQADTVQATLPKLIHPLLLALTTGGDEIQLLALRTLDVSPHHALRLGLG